MSEFELDRVRENLIVLNLTAEHERLSRRKGVRLKPITIELFDSESRWGQYDEVAQTISISRKLILNYSWEHVLGVLKHEAAHQLVAEERASLTREETHHGPKFKEACRRLGLPAQYARAGLDLQSHTFDLRADEENFEVKKILSRVEKLLSLAQSSNEHEAVLAMEKVREIHAKYNLQQAQSLGMDDFVHLVLGRGKKAQPAWEQRIFSILSGHFFVRVITSTQFNADLGDHVKVFELIGTQQNVLMAEYVYRFLLHEVEYLSKKASRDQRWTRRDHNSFKLGILYGFSEKLEAGKKQRAAAGPDAAKTETARTADPQAGDARAANSHSSVTDAARDGLSDVGRALELFNGDTKIDKYLSELYSLTRRKAGSSWISPEAFSSGKTVGKSLNLNKPVSSGDGYRGLRLGSSR